MQVRIQDVMATEVDGQLVVLDLRSSAYLRLNRSGTRLWPLLHRGCREEDLVGELIRVYDLDPQIAVEDVTGFVAMLRSHDLIDVESQPSNSP